MRRLRTLSLAASIVLLAFNVVVGIPSMIALNVVLLTVNGYHLLAENGGRDTGVRGGEGRRLDRDVAFDGTG